MYDRKSDPEAKVIPEITRTGSLIIYRTRHCVLFCTTRSIDQMQASLKNYSECLCITDLASVINFYINNPQDHNHKPFEKQFTAQYSNTVTCKLIASVLGSSRCLTANVIPAQKWSPRSDRLVHQLYTVQDLLCYCVMHPACIFEELL